MNLRLELGGSHVQYLLIMKNGFVKFIFAEEYGTYNYRIGMILAPFKSRDHLLSKTQKIIVIENETASESWFEI